MNEIQFYEGLSSHWCLANPECCGGACQRLIGPDGGSNWIESVEATFALCFDL